MIQDKPNDAPTADRLPSEPTASEEAVVLVVGRSGIDGMGRVIATPFAQLTGPLLDQVRPGVVAFPLVGVDCDAAQVVERLGQLNYPGLALIVAPRLPNPAMVLRELSALVPSLRLEISQREG